MLVTKRPRRKLWVGDLHDGDDKVGNSAICCTTSVSVGVGDKVVGGRAVPRKLAFIPSLLYLLFVPFFDPFFFSVADSIFCSLFLTFADNDKEATQVSSNASESSILSLVYSNISVLSSLSLVIE